MNEFPDRNLENLSLKQILSAITLKQLWAILGAIIAIVVASFSFGQYVSTNKLVKAESELYKIRKEQQSHLARLQFFERAFEYYRTYEIWQESAGYVPPRRWTNKYYCSEEALSFVNSLQALRNTIDRLREYNIKSDIGADDPRGIHLSKAGGEIHVRFSATGDTWTVPDYFHILNPDHTMRATPCDR